MSNAERRGLLKGESPVVPRISDIYAAIPSLTGKFELEYEGELMGAENVARELIREAVAETFSVYLGSADLKAGGRLLRGRGQPEAAATTRRPRSCCRSSSACPGCWTTPRAWASARGDPAPLLAAAGEFVLEGLYGQKKIGRSEDRGFVAPERRETELDLERLERLRRMKKQVN